VYCLSKFFSGADVNKENTLVLQSDNLPQLEVVVGLDTDSPGPSVRNCSFHHSMDQHAIRVVGTRLAREFHQFGEGSRECDDEWLGPEATR
jgi:hypothetical protein